MQWYELSAILDSIDMSSRLSWEQTRTVAYVVAQTQSTKKLKPSDILNFHWDEKTPDADTTISDADVIRLQAKANQLLNLFNHG